jgi:hypothetical protein
MGGGRGEMTSEQINEIIRLLDDEERPYRSGMGDKIVPYIGWYWRDVDFDTEYCLLGILPIYRNPFLPDFDFNDKVQVGFMENNKWGYESFKVEGEAWKTLRGLIELAVISKTEEDFRAVDTFMQTLLPEGKESLEADWAE